MFTRCERGLVAFAQKYGVTRKATLFRLGGASYRVTGACDNNLSKRWKRRRPLGSSVCLPLRSLVVEALFKPYLPYMKGIVVEYLRRRTKLTDFRTVPEDAHELEEEMELLERTMYHRQMTSWLEYFRWYVKVQTDPEVNLGEFFTGPVVCKDWRSQKDTDPLFHQYGLLWKAYDWVLQNYTFQPNILGVGEATVREGEGLQ